MVSIPKWKAKRHIAALWERYPEIEAEANRLKICVAIQRKGWSASTAEMVHHDKERAIYCEADLHLRLQRVGPAKICLF